MHFKLKIYKKKCRVEELCLCIFLRKKKTEQCSFFNQLIIEMGTSLICACRAKSNDNTPREKFNASGRRKCEKKLRTLHVTLPRNFKMKKSYHFILCYRKRIPTLFTKLRSAHRKYKYQNFSIEMNYYSCYTSSTLITNNIKNFILFF